MITITKHNICGNSTLDIEEIYGKEGLRIIISIEEMTLINPQRKRYNILTIFYGKGQISPRFILEDHNPSNEYEDAHKRFMAQIKALSIYKESQIL
jgi:hypothetical protein